MKIKTSFALEVKCMEDIKILAEVMGNLSYSNVISIAVNLLKKRELPPEQPVTRSVIKKNTATKKRQNNKRCVSS